MRQARRQGQDCRTCRRSNIREGSAAFRVTLPAAIRRTPRGRHSAKAGDCRPSRRSNVRAESAAFRLLNPQPFIELHAAARTIGRGSPARRFRPTSFRRPIPHRRHQDFSAPDLPPHAPCPFRDPKAPAIARFRAVWRHSGNQRAPISATMKSASYQNDPHMIEILRITAEGAIPPISRQAMPPALLQGTCRAKPDTALDSLELAGPSARNRAAWSRATARTGLP